MSNHPESNFRRRALEGRELAERLRDRPPADPVELHRRRLYRESLAAARACAERFELDTALASRRAPR